ncbi:MAG: ROK family transcriptional regulator, partial [Meiothermus sp.]
MARRLELSKPTVSQTVELLVRQGVLQEVGRGRIPAGRAPRLLMFNARHVVVAGIDLGASNLRIALADLDGQIFVSRTLPTPQGEDLPERVTRATRALQGECLPGTRLAGVVIGTPGVVSGNRIRLAPNLPALERPGVLKRLREGFGCPLEVHNDV